MSKKKQHFQSKEESERAVKAIVNFGEGNYGIGTQPKPPQGFVEDSITEEGLQDTYINQKK
ncbi:MAG: hypothetical protein ACP5OA_03485 [Candidatus Woesearchaeota archaeon]